MGPLSMKRQLDRVMGRKGPQGGRQGRHRRRPSQGHESWLVCRTHDSDKPTQRSAYTLRCGDRALGQLTGVAHDIGDHQGRERAENPGADASSHWTPINQKLLSEMVYEHRTDRQDSKPGKIKRLSPSSVGLVPD